MVGRVVADEWSGGFAVCHASNSSKSRNLLLDNLICSVKTENKVRLYCNGDVYPAKTKQMKSPLDTLDRELVKLLQANGRASMQDLSNETGPESISRVYAGPEVGT